MTVTQSAGLSLAKSASPGTVDSAGDTVTYTFHVTNTGNVTVSGVDVTEGSFTGTGTLSAVACSVTVLAPGESTDCTATYTVTQADIDRGSIDNTATASGVGPGQTPVVSGASSATVTADQTPKITIVHTADPVVVTAPGQHVLFRYHVVNTGNVTLASVAVTETQFSGTGALTALTCVGRPTLAPGEAVDCTADYTVTQADLDAGSLHSTASTTGNDPAGTAVDAQDDTIVPLQQNPALTLVKTADRSEVTSVGQTIEYSFQVTNTGNVTVSGVAIAEQSFTGSGTVTPSCPPVSLAPGGVMTCSASYVTTAADAARSTIVNTAVATGHISSTLTAVQSGASIATVAVHIPHPSRLASTGVDAANTVAE